MRLAAVLLVGLCVAAAQAARISDVLVRCDAPDLDPESLRQLILGSIRSTPGTEFRPKILSDDVKRLYGLGTFSDVRTELTEQSDGQVLLVFIVSPRPTVRKILVEGNKHYKDKKLLALISQQTKAPLDQVQLSKDKVAIADKYRNAGYYGTTVATELRPVKGTSSVDVVFIVKEMPRAKLKKVFFAGNTVFKSEELRKAIHTRRQWWRYVFRFGNYFNERALALDKDSLQELYATKGYLDFNVDTVEKRFSKNRKWVTVVFHINEGQPYDVSNVSIAIEGDRFTAAELRQHIKLAAGERYSSTVQKKDIKDLRDIYERLGYIDLRCYPVHDRNAAKHTVAVTYRIREGLPARIRDIFMVGNEVTRDRVIRRELAIQPGDLANMNLIRTSQKRLKNLNYFESVEITPVDTERDDLKDLRIQLAEKRTGVFSVGAGFSTDDSVLGFVELTENNFDISRLFRNWPPKGGGQRMRLRLSLGTERSDVRLSFTEPWLMGQRLRLNVELFASTRSYDEYDQSDTGFGVTITRPLKTFWRQSIGVRVDQVTLDDFDSPPNVRNYNDPSIAHSWPTIPRYEDRSLIEEEGDYWANRLIFGLARDTRDDFMYPRHGSKLNFGAELESAILGSYSDIVRLDARGSKFVPLFQRSVLRLRGEVSVAEDIAGDDVAIFDRYFAGGSSSLRGFDFREVGPVDAGDNPLGGKSRLLSTIELARPVGDFMYIHVFMDAGNVWEDSFEFSPSDLNASIGIGFQLMALPLRLDYGFPIITSWDHLEGQSGQIHFNIGYSF